MVTSAADRPWRAIYPEGVQAEISQAPCELIGQIARDTAAIYGDAPAFTCVMPNGMHGTLSFRQTDEMSDAFAVWLRDIAGLKQGDRVAVQVPNGLPYPIVAFGVFKAGCVLVNVNPLYTAEEMGRQFADAKPAVLVIIDMFADKLPEALAQCPIPHVVITRAAEFLPTLPKTIISLVQKYVKKQVPPITVPHLRLPDVLERGTARHNGGKAQIDAYTAGLDGSALACLQYTGGTTGISKGAMLTHANLIMNMAQTMELVGTEIVKGKEMVLTALPLYHIFAFTVNFLAFWWLGAHNLLIPSPRPLTNMQKAFANFPVTWLTGVNTLFNGLCNEPWFQQNPPKHLKFSCAGGMALQGAVAERWQAVTGTPIVEGYGLTETSPVLTFNPFGRGKAGSIGVPIPSTDIRCVDEAGQEVAPGTPGELAAKGPQVMQGYWQRPDETAKVMFEGWFLTGDVAVMDEQGYFRIVDRKKDMVLVSGFNVFPNEVEDVLVKHAGVLEAAVIGVPDGAAGEAVKAFIVKRDPALTEEAVRAFAKDRLTGYKVPKFVEFRSELPKSNVGKILRKDLRTPST